MEKKFLPWDQILARRFVKPLSKTSITPNQLTLLTAFLAFVGAGLLASGDRGYANWGASLFVIARFLDHFDGELARLKGMESKFGYYMDYVAGAGSYVALFLALGIGFQEDVFGQWSLLIGVIGALTAIVAAFSNIAIDRVTGSDETGDAVGYPGFAGFELEDGIYLLAPITWFGFLYPFFWRPALVLQFTVYGLWPNGGG